MLRAVRCIPDPASGGRRGPADLLSGRKLLAQRWPSSERCRRPGRALAADDGGQGVPAGGVASTRSPATPPTGPRSSSISAALAGRSRSTSAGTAGSEPPDDGDYSIAGHGRRRCRRGRSLGSRAVRAGRPQHGRRRGADLRRRSSGSGGGTASVGPDRRWKADPSGRSQGFSRGFESNYDSTSQEYWTTVAGPDSAIQKRLLADLKATPRERSCRCFAM